MGQPDGGDPDKTGIPLKKTATIQPNKTSKVYENRSFVKATGIEIHQLYDYIMKKLENDAEGLKKEFYDLPMGLTADHKTGMMAQNKEKNRYKNMIAYDHSRVHLQDRDAQRTDYINANYILGYEKVQKFIATQGPIDITLDDFWQTVWQENTVKIVMLTNLIEGDISKCRKYWPDSGTTAFGDISVTLKQEQKKSGYTIRSLDVRKGDDPPHRVEQFHFHAWPDKDVPDSAWTLVHFWKKVMTYPARFKGPTVVHCSAGVGRTGTFIALDWLYHQAMEEGVVNFFECVEMLRRQRVNMVQTPTQYVYLHEAVAEALCFSTLPQLTSQYRQWYTHMLEKIDPPGKTDGVQYTRLEIQHQLYLKSLGEYENIGSPDKQLARQPNFVCSVTNYQDEAAFYITNTRGDTADSAFLKLIADKHIRVVVNLSDNDFQINEPVAPVENFDLTSWDENGVPGNTRQLVTLLEDVMKVATSQSPSSPILLHSNLPTERCGLMCILLNEVQRMKADCQVSVLQAVKSMKSSDGRFVVMPNLMQYKFCHDIILEFLYQAEIYQNVLT